MTLLETNETKFYIIEYKPTANSAWKQIDYKRATFDQLCNHMKKEYNAQSSGYMHNLNGGYVDYFSSNGQERYRAYEEQYGINIL